VYVGVWACEYVCETSACVWACEYVFETSVDYF